MRGRRVGQVPVALRLGRAAAAGGVTRRGQRASRRPRQYKARNATPHPAEPSTSRRGLKQFTEDEAKRDAPRGGALPSRGPPREETAAGTSPADGTGRLQAQNRQTMRLRPVGDSPHLCASIISGRDSPFPHIRGHIRGDSPRRGMTFQHHCGHCGGIAGTVHIHGGADHHPNEHQQHL